MRFRSLLALIALLLAAPAAQAQIGGILNRARKAAEDAVRRDPPAQPTPPSASPAPQTATVEQAAAAAQPTVSSDRPLMPTGPMPVSPAGYAPGVQMLDWLTDLAKMRPSATAGSTEIVPRAFSETEVIFPDPEAAYQVVLSNAAGEALTWQDLNLIVDRELPAFGLLKLRNSPENRGRPAFIAEAGSYRAAITANGHEIGGVDFEVVVEASDDPFDSRSTVTMRGPWTTLGALVYDDDDDGSAANDALQFYYWISPTLASSDQVRLQAAIFQGSERLTETRGAEHSLFSNTPGWHTANAQFFKERYPIVLGDLADGDSRIEVFEEGLDPVHVFRFRMEGGVPASHSRSALDYTPRSDFLAPRRNLGDVDTLVWLEADA